MSSSKPSKVFWQKCQQRNFFPSHQSILTEISSVTATCISFPRIQSYRADWLYKKQPKKHPNLLKHTDPHDVLYIFSLSTTWRPSLLRRSWSKRPRAASKLKKTARVSFPHFYQHVNAECADFDAFQVDFLTVHWPIRQFWRVTCLGELHNEAADEI